MIEVKLPECVEVPTGVLLLGRLQTVCSWQKMRAKLPFGLQPRSEYKLGVDCYHSHLTNLLPYTGINDDNVRFAEKRSRPLSVIRPG